MTGFWHLTGRVLRHGLPSLIALLAGIALFDFVQPLVIASFGGATGLDAIMSRIPPALQAFARVRPEFLVMSGLMGYLSLGFTHPLYIIMASAAIVGFAARSLAGEMDRGTVQIALSRPIARPVFYASRVLGALVITILLALTGPAAMTAGVLAARPDGEFEYQNLWAVIATGFALFWAIAGLTLLGSAAASAAGRVVGWLLGILVAAYFIDYFAEIWRLLKPLTFLSLFEYYDPTLALVSGQIDVRNVAILLAIGTLTTWAGLVVFTRRDLPA